MTTGEARDAIIEYLKRELVGPAPGFPATQLNGEEILRPQDPPRLRYSAGVLFPLRAVVPGQLEASQEVVEAAEAVPLEDRGEIESNTDEEPTGNRADLRGDQRPETDLDLNLANQYLPSAMGLSALVEVPEQLALRVRAARYRKEDLPGLGRSGRSGKLGASAN